MGEWIISASVLIGAVTAIRCFYRNKLSMRVRYALWLVVALRLLVPVSFAESSLSVLNFPIFRGTADGNGTTAVDGMAVGSGTIAGTGAAAGAIAGTGTAAKAEKITVDGAADGAEMAGRAAAAVPAPDGAEASSAVPEPSGEQGVVLAEPVPIGDIPAENAGAREAGIPAKDASPDSGNTYNTHGQGFFGKLPVPVRIWLAGAILFLTVMTAVNGSYRRRIYRSRREYRPGTESRLPVYISPVVDIPCMFGLFCPAVYLPPDAAGEEKSLKYILCHENTHYRHRDNLWTVVRALCVCIHWYNPLVWIASDLSRQDCELACDEEALESLGEEERIPYGRTLLDFSVQGYVPFGQLRLSTAMSGRKKQLEERLLMIVGRSGRQAGALAAACVLTLTAALTTFTGRVSGQELEENISGEEAADGEAADAEEQETDFGEPQTADSCPGGTSIVPVDLGDGSQYILKASSGAVPESGEYIVDQIVLNRIDGRREETVQTINLSDAKVLYTRSLEDIRRSDGKVWSYSTEEEPQYAKPLYTVDDLPVSAAGQFLADTEGQLVSYSLDGGIMVEDLNFDGYQDFCIQGKGEGANIPCYCYLWDPAEKRFEPAYMIPNVRADRDAGLLESATDDGDGVHSVKYYRFDEQNILHMVRYVEEDRSPDALFPSLDLTYTETAYGLPAVDEWDYGTRYGGALTERFVYWAKEALAELYEWSGTKIDTASFTVTSYGDIFFGNTPEDLRASRIYYSRVYGEKAGFESCIEQMSLATERTVWYSPVTLWESPDNAGQMTYTELAEWYFVHSPLTKGETPEEIEQEYEDMYTVRAESGNYYQIILNTASREVGSVYGPYDSYPDH